MTAAKPLPPVYDPERPVAPAWQGTRRQQGLRLVAGADHVDAAVDELLAMGTYVAVDIETCGTSPALVRQVKVVTAAARDLAVGMDPRDPRQRATIQRLLNSRRELVFHNATFDVPVLVGLGLADKSIVARVHDTLLTARVGSASRTPRDLSSLAKTLLGAELGDVGQLFKAAGHRTVAAGYLHTDIDTPFYLTSALMDAALTWRLRPAVTEMAVAYLTAHPYQHLGLDRDGALAEVERQQVVGRTMLASTVRGFLIDEDAYQAYAGKVAEELERTEGVLAAAGLTPGNGAALVAKLDAAGDLPAGWATTKATGSLSSAKGDLAGLAGHPLVDAHLFYKATRKNLDDYLSKMLDFADADGRVHPGVNVLGADATGRMSVSNPPIQQFPAEPRRMVLADDPGGWVSIDYSSVEPLVAAFTAGERAVYDAVLSGVDIYVPVGKSAGLIPAAMAPKAASKTPGRSQAKVVLLGLLYGKGVPLLARELGVEEPEAARIKSAVLNGNPAIARWMKSLNNAGSRYGVTISSAGRVLAIGRDFERGGYKGYLAQNYYHQASAYDSLVDALVEIDRRGLSEFVRIAVHDELVVAAEAAEEIQQIMGTATNSLARFLTASGLTERVPILRFPTDAVPLPERWLKV